MCVSFTELPTGELPSARKWSSCKFIHFFLADAVCLAKITRQTTAIEIDLPHIPINTANTSVPKLSNIQSFWKKKEQKKGLKTQSNSNFFYTETELKLLTGQVDF